MAWLEGGGWFLADCQESFFFSLSDFGVGGREAGLRRQWVVKRGRNWLGAGSGIELLECEAEGEPTVRGLVMPWDQEGRRSKELSSFRNRELIPGGYAAGEGWLAEEEEQHWRIESLEGPPLQDWKCVKRRSEVRQINEGNLESRFINLDQGGR